jgi:parvulin-like peptidyl-prolyl isomerase
MKKIFLIGLLIGFFLHLQGKVNESSNDQGITSQEKIIMSAEDFKVYPNPVAGQKFTIESANQPLTEIRISNIAGKPVYQKKLNPVVNRYEVITNDLPAGIYLLHIKAADQSSKTVKLLISR